VLGEHGSDGRLAGTESPGQANPHDATLAAGT
jgi:hypothetical protein